MTTIKELVQEVEGEIQTMQAEAERQGAMERERIRQEAQARAMRDALNIPQPDQGTSKTTDAELRQSLGML